MSAVDDLTVANLRFAEGFARPYRHGRFYDDLRSAAVEGLFQAAQRYRPGPGGFRRWATPRIHGAVVDEIRQLLGRTDPAVCAHGVQSGFCCPDCSTMAGGPVVVPDPRTVTVEPLDDNVIEAVRVTDQWGPDPGPDVASFLDRLEPDRRALASARYVDGLTLREIGAALGVTESRACQLLRKVERDVRELHDAAGVW